SWPSRTLRSAGPRFAATVRRYITLSGWRSPLTWGDSHVSARTAPATSMDTTTTVKDVQRFMVPPVSRRGSDEPREGGGGAARAVGLNVPVEHRALQPVVDGVGQRLGIGLRVVHPDARAVAREP